MFSIYKGYDKGEMAPQGNKKTLKPLKLQGFFWCAVQDSKEVLYIRFLFAVSVLLDIF